MTHSSPKINTYSGLWKREIKNNQNLESDLSKTLFIMIHGFADTESDLLPLGSILLEKGYSCHFIRIDYNRNPKYEDWKKEINKVYKMYENKEYERIFLVGFSVGATLSLELANEHSNISGLILISTFLGGSNFNRFLLNVSKYLPIKKIKRKLQVTNKKTRKQLDGKTHIKKEEFLNILENSDNLSQIKFNFKGPVLFLHSNSDKVSSFKAVSEYIHENRIQNFRLIKIHALNHFIQFDINPNDIYLTIDCFFNLSNKKEEKEEKEEKDVALVSKYEQARIEERFWAEIVFKLIITFFSIFGTFLYFSLPDVLGNTPKAPYYILSYVLILNIYLQLLFLYFFYLVRTDFYLKKYIEPTLSGISWTQFRVNKYISGNASTNMTKLTSIIISVIPMIVSVLLVIYVLFQYTDHFLLTNKKDYFLIVLLVISILLTLVTIYTTKILKKYSNEEVYDTYNRGVHNKELDKIIFDLYEGIIPGSVKQNPNIFNKFIKFASSEIKSDKK